jgi:prepilin-type processing-associated H-X9-DG protein
VNNLKQLSTFSAMYTTNSDDWIPACTGLRGTTPYMQWSESMVADNSAIPQSCFICPDGYHSSDSSGGDWWFVNPATWVENSICADYARNINIAGWDELASFKENQVKKPTETIFVLDSQRNGSNFGRARMMFSAASTYTNSGYGSPPSQRHGGNVNFICLDGHAETVHLRPNVSPREQEPFRFIHWSIARLYNAL